MIEFESIRYKNLLSTGNDWIQVQLNAKPMTLLVGANGAGKSTVIDALIYALFGKAMRQINLPNLINSINQSDCMVEVEFTNNHKKYLVRRGMKPSIFEIYCNGQLVDQEAAKRDTQKYLEKQVLGFNLKAFTQIAVVGSATFVPFMQLKPDDRRAVIEDLLDIQIFSTMNTVLRAKTKLLHEQFIQVKTNIKSVMEKIDLQKKHIAENKKTIDEQIESKNNEIQIFSKRFESLSANTAELTNAITTELAVIQGHDKISVNIRSLETYRVKIDANLDRAKHNLSFFERNSNCTTCSQPLNNKMEMVEKCNNAIHALSAGLAELESKQSDLEAQLANVREMEKRVNGWMQQKSITSTELNGIQRQMQVLQNDIELLREKPMSDDVLAISQSLFDDLTKLNKTKAEVIELKQYADLANSLLKDSGIKAQIVKQYLPLINQTVNKYLASLDFFCDFNIDEEFHETIKSRHRDKFSYENFSEGQKRRIDLSLLFTWRAVAKLKNSINTNLLILDEILDGSLDADGMEEFLTLLNLFGAGTNCFLISHRADVLADKFEHVLEFSLNGNFTEVSEKL